MDLYNIFRDRQDRAVAVRKRLACDTLTPVQACFSVVGEDSGFLLESIPGTYSFVGRFEPGQCLVARAQGDPWGCIPLQNASLSFDQDGLPPLIGGYVGYLGYDMVRGIEQLPRPPVGSGFPDALLGRVDTVLAFDHSRQEVSLIHTVLHEGISDSAAVEKAKQAFGPLEEDLLSAYRIDPPGNPPGCRIEDVSMGDSDFVQAVNRARDYIEQGEIIQVVLSRRLKLSTSGNLFDTYRRLRHINPSPYLFYIRLGEVTLVGSSPEVMVRLRGNTLTALPIAGTRPRGRSGEEDRRLAGELLGNEKERAEHLMLLDLARNDLGRVSLPGTVKVVSREEIRLYSHVMHLVSCVKGTLRPELTGIDALKACFPAGTVSGAPKVRAMQIIDELEGRCRGPYAGAVGYLSLTGDIDTGIAIRTIFSRNGASYVQAGAGIVWDSSPENELREIDYKLGALGAALGGIA